MAYKIDVLGTGSSGNCILIDDEIIIDVGLGYRTLKDALHTCSAIFITHRHGDHLNPSALKQLLKKRPAIVQKRLFVNQSCLEHLHNRAPEVAKAIDPANVINGDHQHISVTGRNGVTYNVETYPLVHDVENQGFVIVNDNNERLIHATDTETMRYAPGGIYDYLLVEGNWDEEQYAERIASGDRDEVFRALRNIRHLSVQEFEKFVRLHSHDESIILQLHQSMELGSKSLIGRKDLSYSVDEPVE